MLRSIVDMHTIMPEPCATIGNHFAILLVKARIADVCWWHVVVLDGLTLESPRSRPFVRTHA